MIAHGLPITGPGPLLGWVILIPLAVLAVGWIACRLVDGLGEFFGDRPVKPELRAQLLEALPDIEAGRSLVGVDAIEAEIERGGS